MDQSLMEKFKWRMAKWLWAPPGEMPASEPEYAEWIKPTGTPVKNKRWHMERVSRGAKGEAPQSIHEFYHRGAYERHEIAARHTPKAAMRFRGKGSKIERRTGKRTKKK
ncbi:MAG TPA: hypothetical protein VMV05_06720 [bacterium]|nr:hypothetical protein [bacterium]